MGCNSEDDSHVKTHIEGFLFQSTLKIDVILDKKKINSSGHSIFFNPRSLQMYCFECDKEVLDFDL